MDMWTTAKRRTCPHIHSPYYYGFRILPLVTGNIA
jgi:hypothetical protein